jgi:hypothetical protein
MEVISLREYMKCFPKLAERSIINELRGCSICGCLKHHSQMLFLMATKINGYGSLSANLCQRCLPRWKELLKQHRLVSSPSEWHWSTWDISKPFPHHEVDRVFLHIGEDGELYLQAHFNPSKRERNVLIEEIK